MKASQLKIMVGWLIGLSAICIVLLVLLMINVMSIKKQVNTLSDNTTQPTSSSQQTSSPTNSSSSQLTDIQNSLNTLIARPSPSSTSSSMTCSGLLSLSLSGLIIDNENISMNSSTPVSLNCSSL
jgi:type II secretory pathway component PulC